MAEQAEKFSQNAQATPIPFSLQMQAKHATISNDRLFCSGYDNWNDSVALGVYPLDAATMQKLSFQFNLQGNTTAICMGVSKNTIHFTDDYGSCLGWKEGEWSIVNQQGALGWRHHNGNGIKIVLQGWKSVFQENKPVTMTLDTEKEDLTIFDSEQVSMCCVLQRQQSVNDETGFDWCSCFVNSDDSTALDNQEPSTAATIPTQRKSKRKGECTLISSSAAERKRGRQQAIAFTTRIERNSRPIEIQ